jgi:hypothetical protein
VLLAPCDHVIVPFLNPLSSLIIVQFSLLIDIVAIIEYVELALLNTSLELNTNL